MGRTERIVLWILVVIAIVGLVVATAVIFGELSAIDHQLLVIAGDERSASVGETQDLLPTIAFGGNQTTQVAIAGVRVLTGSVALTVTVRAYGAGDLLFEPPLLRSDEGQTYPVIGDSLAKARIAFLDLVTRGETSAHLEFAGRPSPTSGLWLVFNPSQESTSVIAPLLEVPVSLRTGD